MDHVLILFINSVNFLLSDVEMYRAGRETKVYGSRNYSKPTVCAEGQFFYSTIEFINYSSYFKCKILKSMLYLSTLLHLLL